MLDKRSFYESIGPDTIFNDEFYKKVYGYSIYDKEFLNQISTKLISIGKGCRIHEYNEWFNRWQHEYLYGEGTHKGFMDVVHWYANVESPRQWQELLRKHQAKDKHQGKEVKEWDMDSLLLKKKELLLKMKLLLLNEK
jgi:hypothetical protein